MEASISLLSFSIRGQIAWKPQSQETNQSKSHESQPCLTQWNHEPCCVGPPKTYRSLWRVLTKHGPLEKGMANHFSILALRTQWPAWKGKKIGHWKMNSQVGRCPICTWWRVEKKLQKEWRDGPNKNNTQLWMWLVMEIKSDAVKNNIT